MKNPGFITMAIVTLLFSACDAQDVSPREKTETFENEVSADSQNDNVVSEENIQKVSSIKKEGVKEQNFKDGEVVVEPTLEDEINDQAQDKEPGKDEEEEQTSSEHSCEGYLGFIADRSWFSIYGGLSNQLKEDIDSVFDHKQIENTSFVMSSKFSNQPSKKHNQECGETTLIAPATHKEMSFGSPVLCHGFLKNPNKDRWTCEPISSAAKALNKQNCPISEKYENALACAPKDIEKVEYKIDENPCRGNVAKGKKATIDLILKNKREMNGYYGDSEIHCQVEIRSKCADFDQENVENFVNYVNCGAKHNAENKKCLGFPEELNTHDTTCFLDDLSEQRGNHQSCGAQYRCFFKE